MKTSSFASLNDFTQLFPRCLWMALMGLILLACSTDRHPNLITTGTSDSKFYSAIGKEVQVEFNAIYQTTFKDLASVENISESRRRLLERNGILETIAFLFGPLSYRDMGGPKRNQSVKVDWSSPRLNSRGFVELSYQYKGQWLLTQDIKSPLRLPLPYTADKLYTPQWKSCSDSAPDHQTPSFFWYFWDPTRSGCDHVLNEQYQMINVALTAQTTQQTQTYPEYSELLKSAGQKNNLQMTFAFGYVEETSNPKPETDRDQGMLEYQKFLRLVRTHSQKLRWEETPILSKEYLGSRQDNIQVGSRFRGQKDGVQVTLNLVAAAGIDQMELFAKSFAHDHDGFFAWFGHSRVGSGFDAQNFKQMVDENPRYYSISPNYQLVYWNGCNSYSYYTLPFFQFKADLNPSKDPNGTKGLDIIANGLPTYFSFNAANAQVALQALLRWEEKTSYQKLIQSLEDRAAHSGTKVIVNVLGDEDNAR